jgi:hypothetical protein
MGTGLAMRWDVVRERAMPMAMSTRDRAMDVAGRMSSDYLPRAADLLRQASKASEPYRTEAAARGVAALAAVRGRITGEDARRLAAARARRQRILVISLVSGAAAAACGAFLGRRRKDVAWVADEDAARGDGGGSVRSLSERASRRAHEAADRVRGAARGGEQRRRSEGTPRYADGTEIDDRAGSWH